MTELAIITFALCLLAPKIFETLACLIILASGFARDGDDVRMTSLGMTAYLYHCAFVESMDNPDYRKLAIDISKTLTELEQHRNAINQ